MMGTVVLFVVGILVICFGLGFFEYLVAKKAKRWGLVMPCVLFVISVMSIVQSVPAVFGDMTAVGGVTGAVLSLIFLFVLINVPTVITYAVFRVVRKRGEASKQKHNKSSD